ncbi:MAG TPA: methyltransferase domain-containing protein [Bryobacteraceae bacterium]|jgi:SAM-dependent methyltransferase|nr:methyltransferase domain-containing protein [Bryobacteraceae bacterium]
MPAAPYVHGYSPREAERLSDQANTLNGLLHEGIRFAPERRVLEVGCGTGAQTLFLAADSPDAEIVSVDRSPLSLAAAQRRGDGLGYRNVRFVLADLFHLPFAEASFDDVFVCFVLEHLAQPDEALRTLRRMLKPGGTITVIEGDHGSWYCHPQTPEAARTVQCLIEVQARMGGDSLIGRSLYPLLARSGFRDTRVIPRMVYVDGSRPDLIEGFSRNTFVAMVEGVREQALALGLMDAAAWDRGIADLYRATEPDGTFCYTFFRAIATRID